MAAPPGACSPPPAARTEYIGSAEKIFKNILYIAEMSEVLPLESASSECAFQSLMAKLVIRCALIRVAQDFVCLGNFLELFLGRFITLMFVRVILVL